MTLPMSGRFRDNGASARLMLCGADALCARPLMQQALDCRARLIGGSYS